MSKSTEILIIGAGLAGLAAATRLKSEGLEVIVVDKGRGVGGRLATRRIGEASFDHGAQFMTVRDPDFRRQISEWAESGVISEWFRGSENLPEAHIRWRGVPSMTGIAKNLAKRVKVLLSTRVVSLKVIGMNPDAANREHSTWRAETEAGDVIFADKVILTAPVPQSLALLDVGSTLIPQDIRNFMNAVRYEACIAVMAVLDGPSALDMPGGLVRPHDSIAWIADNYLKGVSKVPAVTIHADPAFSEEYWSEDRKKTGAALINAANDYLGSNVTDFQVHGWLYSKAAHASPSRFIATWASSCGRSSGSIDQAAGRSAALIFAGDAFGGPNLEGAFLSGHAAAAHVISSNK